MNKLVNGKFTAPAWGLIKKKTEDREDDENDCHCCFVCVLECLWDEDGEGRGWLEKEGSKVEGASN